MKIMGIDPGTRVMGYGVILCTDDGNLHYVAAGAISQPRQTDLPRRLHLIHRELLTIMREHAPNVVAVEDPFVARNVKSALAIGQAQAVALIAAAELELPCFQYSPLKIKQMVTSFGGSDKAQVQDMVRLQLGLAEAPEPHDAADALAAAICHVRESHLNDLLAGR
jgi:crossover junction endodeoxyribonuclease RuvC